ncbi:serine hydrolase domain-containing protein [Nakamurella lactea]|uniref:serine hydrolase domain-containing protein n=1 Tax=Nakamurella lactea TaxID=459515 RepID=UPI000418F515|nr:serine hydrolase domain-containing protein [Nakamurella lactea]
MATRKRASQIPAENNTADANLALTASLEYVRSWLEYRVWRTRVPGAQVAIWFDGKRQFARSFGLANVATGEQLTNSHLFRIASHSKTFTATSVLQLAAAGKLRLDDEVQQYVPRLVGAAIGTVTIRELASHAGGVSRDSADGDFWSLARPFPDAEAFDEILRQDLDVTVSSHAFKYTNIGYSILGMVIEAASGQSYDDYTRDHIVSPLRLRNTASDVIDKPGTKYAAAHSGVITDFDREIIPNVPTGAMAAATGFSSTASDLVRYAAAHFTGSGELLDDRSKRWMRQALWQVEGRDGSATSYGLGLAGRKIHGRSWYGHGGGWPGHITRTLWEPELGIAVSSLTNAIDGPAEDLTVGVIELLMTALDRPRSALRPSSGLPNDVYGAATRAPAATAGSVDLDAFTGRYASPWALVDIARLGDQLFMIPPTAPNPVAAAEPLTVIDAATLRTDGGSGYDSLGELVHFEFDKRGRVSQLRGGSGMRMRPAPKPVPFSQSRD